ncbi:hypothetical protein AXG93_3256s1360 [Marchantia polymorpha subsp. ruderalis]|uniref:Uncharacterized protein n=1 Tax=Marchantia polymorpha subsp. ruderalis TaxID=1480154 RepID=A0A176VIX7_MARPO|nr:hypothetical protein AXG93_3256s1360 [Marchantia polymorpha subsp. ruderalis]
MPSLSSRKSTMVDYPKLVACRWMGNGGLVEFENTRPWIREAARRPPSPLRLLFEASPAYHHEAEVAAQHEDFPEIRIVDDEICAVDVWLEFILPEDLYAPAIDGTDGLRAQMMKIGPQVLSLRPCTGKGHDEIGASRARYRHDEHA